MDIKYSNVCQQLTLAVSHNDYVNVLTEMIKISPYGYFNIIKTLPFKKLYDEIMQFTPLLVDKKYSMTTRCYWYIHNIIEFPKCHKCGKPLVKNIKSTLGYSNWCSTTCKNSDQLYIEKCRQTRYKRNGGKWHADDYSDKVKQGTIRNGHSANWKNPDKMKATKLKNHGSSSYVNPEKAKQTRYKQNGGKFCSDKEIELRKLHNKSKFTYKRGQQTYFNRTGYFNPGQNPEVIKRTKSSYYYDSLYFRSSWELAKYIYHKDKHDNFQYQPSITLKYLDINGKEHIYHPDFIVNGILQEVKGDQFFKDGKMTLPYRYSTWTDQKYKFMCDLYHAKYKCMIDNNVQILTYNDIRNYLDYIKMIYGKDYLKQFRHIKLKS